MFPDVKLNYERLLTEDERALSAELRKAHQLNLTQTYQWLLLAEISQLRAMAENLHNRLVSLVNTERSYCEHELDAVQHEGRLDCAFRVCKKCGVEVDR
jgi:hypothetical protein